MEPVRWALPGITATTPAPVPALALTLALALALTACARADESPYVIDGSTAESFAQTMKQARGDLAPKDRLKFEAALTEFRAQMFAKADNRAEYQELVREGMHGLTAPAIVHEYDRNTSKAGNDAADAIFDARRALTKS